ncbi:hypothetical protein IHE45_15G071500, partial [Dioscorea alata]
HSNGLGSTACRPHRHRHRRIPRHRPSHRHPPRFSRRQHRRQLLLQLHPSRTRRRRDKLLLLLLPFPRHHRSRRRLQPGRHQSPLRSRRGGVQNQAPHPREQRRRHRRQLLVSPHHIAPDLGRSIQHQRAGLVPLLPRSGKPAGSRRGWEDHHVDELAGGVVAARVRRVRGVEGGGGGDDQGDGEGAEREWDHGELRGSRADRDGYVLLREVGGDGEGGGWRLSDGQVGGDEGCGAGGGVLGHGCGGVGEWAGCESEWGLYL